MFKTGFNKIAVTSKLYLKAANKVSKEMGDKGSSALTRMANIFPWQRPSAKPAGTFNLPLSKTRLRHAKIRAEVGNVINNRIQKG
jgi:hypothetical protein